jgi:two-component system, OmpR family, sensor histidine kinase KdpD
MSATATLPEPSPPRARHRGSLKLFLGYAPGVGKTYSMLSEAIRRHSRGEDVVIGIVESHGRKAIEELASQLEAVPRKRIEYKGTPFLEMDVDAILARRPQVVLVDELAHTNIPGSRHRKRYEDVLELLEHPMEILSTVNIQHMESFAPLVRSITGVPVRETLPDWVIRNATETVMVDLTPEALQNRLRRGDVYSSHKVEQALRNFFRRGNLIALRELALRQVAEQVDRSLESYMTAADIHNSWPVRERIAVSISPSPKAQYLIARASRMARRMDAEWYVIYVDLGSPLDEFTAKSLQSNLDLAENLGAKVQRLEAESVLRGVVDFVREKHITQVIFGRTAAEGWRRISYLVAMNRFLREAPAVDVHIVTQEPE